MSVKKPELRSVLLVAIPVILLAAAGVFFLQNGQSPAGAPEADIQPSADATATDEAAPEATVSGFPGNTPGPTGERTIGDPNAPIKITEYSSLTCHHCADFHKNTLAQLKTHYIDTGKVFFIFSDFPLNAPAMHGSMVARCLPDARYYDFLQLLFETQEKWATEASYLTYLKQNAQLAGLSGEEFDACIEKQEIRDFIVKRMGAVQETQTVQSTPTFVFGSGRILRGTQPFEAMAKAIDEELAQSGGAPAAGQE
jgi:protein-disulfide isomerase